MLFCLALNLKCSKFVTLWLMLAQLSHRLKPACHQSTSVFFCILAVKETGSQGFWLASQLWPDDKNVIFMPQSYDPAHLCLQMWMTVEVTCFRGKSGCYALSHPVLKHHLPSLFTADSFPVSHMHFSKLPLLSFLNVIHWCNRFFAHSILQPISGLNMTVYC